jgi:hypothetical protein
MSSSKDLLREARDFIAKSRCSAGHSVSEVQDRAKKSHHGYCVCCAHQFSLYRALSEAISVPDNEPGSLRPGLERAIEIVSKLDTFTEPGGTGSGLLGAEESTSYVNAFRDHVVDKLDAAIGEPEPTPPPFSVGDEVEWRGHKGVVVSTEQRVSVCLSFKYTHDIPIADLKRLGPTKVSAT